MMKLIVITFFIVSVFAEEDKRMDEINVLRTLRRMKAIEHHGLEPFLQSNRQKKDEQSNALKCNSCTFSGGSHGCSYKSEICTENEICCDIWRDHGHPRNFNGCIHPDLCTMMKDTQDNSYVRIKCCDGNYCNF